MNHNYIEISLCVGVLEVQKIADKMSKKNIYIFFIVLVLIYIFFVFYFQSHFLFRTYIDGINISYTNIDGCNEKIENYINNFELKLEEKNNNSEIIYGNDIDLKYNKDNEKIKSILEKQNNYLWIISLFKKKEHLITDSIKYNDEKLTNNIMKLQCFNDDNIILPKNPQIIYGEDGYYIKDEVYGNKLNEKNTIDFIKKSIVQGVNLINFEKENLYEKPNFYSHSDKVIEAKQIMDKYITTKIVFDFGNCTETLDYSVIKNWLSVNDDMEVNIDEKQVADYVKQLELKYNTLGKERNFTTSSGKKLVIKDGNYGFKINSSKEISDIINSVKNAQTIIREPSYTQKARCRNDSDDIGDTYVEVNITRQMLWFYKNGKLVVSGDVVTGNISRGNGTHLGIYELNYKENNATLKGFGYSSKVKYWMPFDGNIGLHDASWRGSFGGNIYKTNGTHGCVNLPTYLAKKIYEEIEPGTPIICYVDE